MEVVGKLLTQGILGVLVVVLGIAYIKKDRALTDLSESFRNLMMNAQEKIFTTANKMSEGMEANEKYAEELDRRERDLERKERDIERREHDVELRERDRESPRRPPLR